MLGDFSNALEAICRIGTDGATKYTPSGWRHVPNGVERYEDAMLRHYLAVKKGEVIDPGSGSPHWWHIAWNVLAVVELQHGRKESADNAVQADIDKRPRKLHRKATYKKKRGV